STITATPTTIPANGTSTSPITVQLKDASGNDLTTSAGTVALSTTAGTLSAVTDNGNGTYSATLVSTVVAQNATVSGTLNGAALADTAAVWFGPGSASAATSIITASPSTIPADGTSTSAVTVQAKDASGVNLATGGATVTLAATAG